MTFGPATEAQRCPICLRSRQQAIADHLRSRENCDSPYCPFRAAIEEALQRQERKPRFHFGPVRKPAFVFTPHKEPVAKEIIRKIDDQLKRITEDVAATE